MGQMKSMTLYRDVTGLGLGFELGALLPVGALRFSIGGMDLLYDQSHRHGWTYQGL